MPEDTLVEQEYGPHGQRLRLTDFMSYRKEDLRRGVADVHTSGAGDIYTCGGGKGQLEGGRGSKAEKTLGALSASAVESGLTAETRRRGGILGLGLRLGLGLGLGLGLAAAGYGQSSTNTFNTAGTTTLTVPAGFKRAEILVVGGGARGLRHPPARGGPRAALRPGRPPAGDGHRGRHGCLPPQRSGLHAAGGRDGAGPAYGAGPLRWGFPASTRATFPLASRP